jgi:dephospho-CoA kinase
VVADLEKIEWVVLLSGPVAVGKTTLRDALVVGHGFSNVRSSEYLRQRAASLALIDDRLSLQELGDKLDRDTDYRWLVDDVALPLFRAGQQQRWLVDAVRKERQVQHFKAAIPGKVLHVHLTAPEHLIRSRFALRLGVAEADAEEAYLRTISHSNEQASKALIEVADLVVDTSEDQERSLSCVIAKLKSA